MADPAQIHQLLINLCSNAERAMRDTGGVLSVSLSHVSIGEEPIEDRSVPAPGSYLLIQVKDTGCGIDKNIIGKIFDPYFTTKDKSGGGGLGLAVVHGIVEGHGGTITVQSEVGKGTDVNVYLPVSEPETDPFNVDTDKVKISGNVRILLVDDEPGLLEIGKRMLESMGYSVETTNSSVEALDLIQEEPGRFDIVITDMTMPFLMGDELSKEILRIRHDMPIILCSGYSEKINVQKALELGARAYVHKPFTTSQLIDAIRRALDQ